MKLVSYLRIYSPTYMNQVLLPNPLNILISKNLNFQAKIYQNVQGNILQVKKGTLN